MSYINSSVRDFELGAISSFIGSFLGRVFDQFINNTTDERIDIGNTQTYSSVIAGGFSAIIIPKVGALAGVVLAVGLNKLVFDVVDRMFCGEGLSQTNILQDFIFDSIALFFLIQILINIINLVKNNENEDADNENEAGDNENEEETEEVDEEIVVESILISFVANIYYTLKRSKKRTF